nr:hypothetical protein [Tanacetum cinerariifolium]
MDICHVDLLCDYGSFSYCYYSYSSYESVGSLPSRVFLFDDIPIVIPSTSVIAPETSAIAPVISSATPVVETTIVASPIGLCGLVPYLDLDSDLPDEMASLEYITSLPATSSFLFTDSSEDLDPYEASGSSEAPPSYTDLTRGGYSFRSTLRTRPNRPRKVITTRKRVGPLPTRRLAWRRVSPRSLDHRPSSSSSPTILYQFILGVWMHQVRLILDLRLELYHLDWVTLGRCRSLTNFIPSSAPVIGSLDPTRADLLPPHKRDDRKEFEASAGDKVMLGIDPRSVPMVDEEIVEPIGGDSSSSSSTRDGTLRIVGIETTQRQLEADQMIASGERVGMAESIWSLRSENLKIHDDHDDLRRKLRRLESFTERRLGFRR